MRLALAGVAMLMLAGQVQTAQCGSTPSPSSSGTPGPPAQSAANVLPIAANAGPTNGYLNGAFATVTLCVPGTSNCQTLGGILIDTGSYGLRVLSSAVGLPLPQQTNLAGAPVAECLPFLDSVVWGAVATADVKIAGETASAIPVQIIGTDRFPAIPADCSSQGAPSLTQDDLQANGVLGIGLGIHDCGNGCALTGASNPGLYYACPAGAACQITAMPLTGQVVNPVAIFPVDNNGTILQLPAVPTGGAGSVAGSLIFGIGTQSNNGLGTARVFTTDARGNFTTTFNGQNYPGSFIDSGSNAIFFLDSAASGLPDCTLSKGFYCPPSLRTLSATHTGANGITTAVSFNAGNVDALNATFSVMAEATGSQAGAFDWGLPFFYGRSVFTAIAGRSTPGGFGPYWAY